MNRHSRRTLFALVGASALAALAACNLAPSTPSQATTDIQSIASGLSGILTALQAVPGVPASVIAQVQQELTLIQSEASSIGGAVVSGDVVQTISNALGIIATLVSPFFPAAPGIAAGIQAAITIVTNLLKVFGLPQPAKFARAAASAPPMSLDNARAVLAHDAAAGMK